MRCSLFIGLILDLHLLTITYAATIPPMTSLLSPTIDLNSSYLQESLGNLTFTKSPTAHLLNTSVASSQPWPPAPFTFTSQMWDGWNLTILSYNPALLTYNQKKAIMALCIEYIDVFLTKDPSQSLPAETFPLRLPRDYDNEDVEIAFFNAAWEAGESYTVEDIVYSLNVVLETVLTGNPMELAMTVAHYAVVRPGKQGSGVLKRMGIRRRTDGTGVTDFS